MREEVHTKLQQLLKPLLTRGFPRVLVLECVAIDLGPRGLSYTSSLNVVDFDLTLTWSAAGPLKPPFR